MNVKKTKVLLFSAMFCGICTFSTGCTPGVNSALNSLEYNLRNAFYYFPYNFRSLYYAIF